VAPPQNLDFESEVKFGVLQRHALVKVKFNTNKYTTGSLSRFKFDSDRLKEVGCCVYIGTVKN